MHYFTYRAAVIAALRYRGKTFRREDLVSRAWKAKLSVSDAAIIIGAE